ncbi:unnamed protein product [Arabidopsis halleri]
MASADAAEFKIYVSNLDTDTNDLEDAFSKFGDVIESYVFTQRRIIMMIQWHMDLLVSKMRNL